MARGPVHEGRPGRQPGGRGPARLRRDGRPRRGASTPAASARGDSVAVFGCGGVGNAAVARRPARRARRRIIAVDVDDRKLERARGARRHPHGRTPRDRDVVEAIRELTGGFGADVVIEAVGRPETYDAGVLRPRPRGHGRARRRADAGDAPRPAADRLLRPRRRAEVVLVRRLPAVARLPDAHRPLPAGPARPRRASSPRRSASTTWRPRSTKMQRGEVLRSVVLF